MHSTFRCLVLAVLTLSCSSTPKSETPPAALQETPAQASGPNCTDETFCTREYRPTVCQFGGQEFTGSNPCEARKVAKHYACEKNLPFVEDKVECTARVEKPLAAAKDCSQRKPCTREMRPHQCTFGGEKFRGNNRCEAVQKVRNFACERGLLLDEKSLVCEPAKDQKERAG